MGEEGRVIRRIRFPILGDMSDCAIDWDKETITFTDKIVEGMLFVRREHE